MVMLPRRTIVLFAALALFPLSGRCQEPSLRLQGLVPTGTRTTVGETWVTLQFVIVNPTPEARDARVVAFFADQPSMQYARDVWVPAHASLTTWMPIGPAPNRGAQLSRELHALLFDRTGGQDRLILPSTDERVRSRLVGYRPRQPTTGILVDTPVDLADSEHLSRPDSAAGQAILFVHALRAAAGLPEQLTIIPNNALPPTPEAFEGTEAIVLAGNRLAADPAGIRALRQWVERGGRLWILVDMVDPKLVSAVLGDALPFEVVDRVGLTTVQLHPPSGTPIGVVRPFDRPVEMVRVLTTPDDQIMAVVNGWPAAFLRTIGRGRIVFTTLGGRGWHRPRSPNEVRSPYQNRPDLPVGLPELLEIAAELHPQPQTPTFTPDDLNPLLMEDIGYSVPSRQTAAAILGSFVLSLVAIGALLRRSRRPELIGWLAAIVAVASAGLFVLLATSSRRAVPPTVATVTVSEAVPGSEEIAASGLFAVYSPESGETPIATNASAVLDFDFAGLEGQTRRRVQTDTDAWHFEGLALPGGVRTGRIQQSARVGSVLAVARFGANGVEGRLTAAAFQNLEDALVSTPGRDPIAVRIAADGSFTAGMEDVLPPGQFLASAVLTDKQQRRQDVYRKLLASPVPRHTQPRQMLLVWAEPRDRAFTAQPGERSIASTLLVIPMEFERPAAGTRVTVPPALIQVRRSDLARGQPTMESVYPAEMRLRFQLPESVVPMTVERAILHLRVRAPSRRVAVDGLADDQPVPIFAAENPAEPIRLEIADPRLIRTDEQGGLHLVLSITNVGDAVPETPWRIETLGLEVVGKTDAGR